MRDDSISIVFSECSVVSTTLRVNGNPRCRLTKLLRIIVACNLIVFSDCAVFKFVQFVSLECKIQFKS